MARLGERTEHDMSARNVSGAGVLRPCSVALDAPGPCENEKRADHRKEEQHEEGGKEAGQSVRQGRLAPEQLDDQCRDEDDVKQ